jgi:hypothetical protein
LAVSALAGMINRLKMLVSNLNLGTTRAGAAACAAVILGRGSPGSSSLMRLACSN